MQSPIPNIPWPETREMTIRWLQRAKPKKLRPKQKYNEHAIPELRALAQGVLDTSSSKVLKEEARKFLEETKVYQ